MTERDKRIEEMEFVICCGRKMHGGGVREEDEMRKLKVPVLVENANLPETMKQREFEICFDKAHYEFVPEFEFEADGLNLISSIDNDDQGSYLYAYIVGGEDKYYENALVKTDDFHFRTYAGLKKAVKDMAAQLVKRWKAWVRGLYREE